MPIKTSGGGEGKRRGRIGGENLVVGRGSRYEVKANITNMPSAMLRIYNEKLFIYCINYTRRGFGGGALPNDIYPQMPTS